MNIRGKFLLNAVFVGLSRREGYKDFVVLVECLGRASIFPLLCFLSFTAEKKNSGCLGGQNAL